MEDELDKLIPYGKDPILKALLTTENVKRCWTLQ